MVVQSQQQGSDTGRIAREHAAHASPFLMEPDGIPDAASFTPGWVRIERIAQSNQHSPHLAEIFAAEFKTIGETPEGRTQLVEALRTENPPIFKHPAARYAALQALGSCPSDIEVQRVCVEELETHPEFEESCRVAASSISLCPSLDSPELANRLTRVALDFPDTAYRGAVMSLLKPSLAGCASSDTMGPIIAAVRKEVLSGAVPDERAVHALALSGNPQAHAVLKEIALGTLRKPFEFIEELGYAPDSLDDTPPLTFIAGGAAAAAAFMYGAVTSMPAPMVLGMIAGSALVGALLPLAIRYFLTREERLIRNQPAQAQALTYLGLTAHHAPMQSVLAEAKHISDQTPELKAAFAAATQQLNLGWDSVVLARTLGSPLNELRREAVRRLGSFPSDYHPVPGELATVGGLLAQLKSDHDPEVRKIAYQAAKH